MADVQLFHFQNILATNESSLYRVARSAKCPPVKKANGFSPFAFLAFILISVNTIMNISNNISNNNNNRNNNNNDNNNNNLFNSNNVNMRRSFEVENVEKEDIIFALRTRILSPWSAKFFDYLRSQKEATTASKVIHSWMSTVAEAFPGCLLNTFCEVTSRALRINDDEKIEPSCWKSDCPLYYF